MEKYDFIKLMLKSRNLSVNDKKRLLLLATRELENVEAEDSSDDTGNKNKSGSQGKVKSEKSILIHAPKDTATFLALFNNPEGFKFLTHDFDPDSDMDYEKLMKLTRDCFNAATKKYRIPRNLYALMYTMLYGVSKDGEQRKWMDCDGLFHEDNYNTASWIEWTKLNPKVHLLANEEFGKTILKFRSSIRLVKPMLSDILSRQIGKHPDLNIQTENLEKADIYTYVWSLENGIKRILDDMSRYSCKTPNVKVSFERQYTEEFSYRIIKITQIDSVSSSLDDVLRKFNSPEKGGAFNEIKKVFVGYCNWSVEAMWDGIPKRWNILSDEGKPEVEDIPDESLLGFTHILTYYNK